MLAPPPPSHTEFKIQVVSKKAKAKNNIKTTIATKKQNKIKQKQTKQKQNKTKAKKNNKLNKTSDLHFYLL